MEHRFADCAMPLICYRCSAIAGLMCWSYSKALIRIYYKTPLRSYQSVDFIPFIKNIVFSVSAWPGMFETPLFHWQHMWQWSSCLSSPSSPRVSLKMFGVHWLTVRLLSWDLGPYLPLHTTLLTDHVHQQCQRLQYLWGKCHGLDAEAGRVQPADLPGVANRV